MGIKLEKIKLKKDDKVVFQNLDLTIPYKKIIGLFGDKKDDFVELLMTKDFNTGKLLDDDNYLDDVLLIDDYDEFVTYFPKYALIIKEMEAYVDDRCEETRLGLNSVKKQLYSAKTTKYEFYNLVKDKSWGKYALNQFDAIRNGSYDIIGIREYIMKDVKIYQKLKEHLRINGIRPNINEIL